MDPLQALSILDQASAAFSGNREAHKLIQEAVVTLQNLIQNSPQPQPQEQTHG